MNTINIVSALSLIFLVISLAFFSASVLIGIKRDVLGIQKVAKYYYTGSVFMGLGLFLILTLENGLTIEAFILPTFLIILAIIFFKTHIFMQKMVEEIVGDISFLSLLSRIKNFINLIGKRK